MCVRSWAFATYSSGKAADLLAAPAPRTASEGIGRGLDTAKTPVPKPRIIRAAAPVSAPVESAAPAARR